MNRLRDITMIVHSHASGGPLAPPPLPIANPQSKIANPKSAFTLVELLIASIITVFIAGATTAAVSQALRARAATEARLEARARAETAAARIAADLRRVVRDTDLYFARLSIIDGGRPGEGGSDEILFFMRSDQPVRPASGQPEGDEYEVQYRLVPGGPSASAATIQHRLEAGAAAGATGSLWRRVDPVPDEYPDAGGVASAVVDGLTSLSIEATDGLLWYASWDSDSDGYPHAVRLTITATDESGRHTATARRVIALDRTPQPYDTLLERIVEEEEGA